MPSGSAMKLWAGLSDRLVAIRATRKPVRSQKPAPRIDRWKKTTSRVLIRKIAIIPAVKVLSGDDAHFAAEAVTHGGIPIVAITMIVPGAVELIAHLCRSQGKVAVGAGTVLDVETAGKCIDAGACFLTSPNFNPAIVEFVAKENMAVVPGALTPSEVVAAWNAGADFVKIFPCAPVGGDNHIKALHGSLAQYSFDRSRRRKSANGRRLHFGRCHPSHINAGRRLHPQRLRPHLVHCKGHFRWKKRHDVFLSEVLWGERIGLLPLDERWYTVCFAQVPLGRFDSWQRRVLPLPASCNRESVRDVPGLKCQGCPRPFIFDVRSPNWVRQLTVGSV